MSFDRANSEPTPLEQEDQLVATAAETPRAVRRAGWFRYWEIVLHAQVRNVYHIN